MTGFVLRIDLANHEHPGNHAGQHAKVCELLRLAMQQIGSDSKRRKGALTVPHFNASRGVNDVITIGSWEFTETHNQEA
jgi:hypothetical protein